MAGFGLTLGGGSIAVRGSFGLSYSTFSTAGATTPKEPGRWAGDADLLIPDSFFGLGSIFGGALHPYGLVGIGARSIRTSPTWADADKSWSYGGGVSVPLGQALSIEGEMRNRTPLSTNILSPSSGTTTGTEFRLALDFRFGNRRGGGSGIGGSRSSGTTVWPTGNNAAGAARRVVPRGEKYIGVPYVWGGDTPQGFDCSGFVQYVYRAEGVDLPRTSRQMAGSGFAVSKNEMAIGDLMLFADNGEPISHVAIYAGNGRFIHSSSSGNGVRYDDLNSGRGAWFRQNLVAVRRVATGSGAASVAAFAKSLIPFAGFDPPDRAPRARD